MADSRRQLEAYKASVNVSLKGTQYKRLTETSDLYDDQRLHLEMQEARSKDEAIKLAIRSAELLMKSLKLDQLTPADKKDLKSQCEAIMDEADRIKRAKHWPPDETPSPSVSKSKDIGKWVTDVVRSAPPPQQLDADLNYLDKSFPPNNSPVAVMNGDSNIPKGEKHKHIVSSGFKTDETLVEISNPSDGAALPSGKYKDLAPTPEFAPAAKIHRLKVPASSRKRSKREDIIILKASKVNGFQFPPWSHDPPSSEFNLCGGTNMFLDTRELSLSVYQQQFFQDWVPAARALPPPSMVSNKSEAQGPVMHSSLPIDLVQDAATDCSVVASLCAGVARAERGHDEVLSNGVFPYDRSLHKPVLSLNGKYIVRLYFNGCWRKVVIDDRLPMSKTHRLLHVVDRRTPALLWPALLEKAYLKVRGGYDFPGSNSCSDLLALTGWIPEEIYLQETETVPSELWKRVHNAFQYGDVLVTLGTGKMSTGQERELGLEGQHSYVVLDMKQINDDRMLLVKNPWVEGRGWRGPQPATTLAVHTLPFLLDDETARRKDHEQSTSFWIGLDQVMQHYERLYLNWNPGLFSYRQDIHFQWAIGSSQGAGAFIANNPQFTFSSKGPEVVWFLLSRHFRNTPDTNTNQSDAFNDGSVRPGAQPFTLGDIDSLKGYMGIFVCGNNGERVYMKESYLESTPYVSTPQCLLRWEADGGDAYTVVIDQEGLPESSYTFTLSAFSNTRITLEPATEKYKHQKVEKGVWDKHTAGGDTGSVQYFENPQYTLEVREPCSLAILLTSINQGESEDLDEVTSSAPLNVKFALGYGKRLYRLQSRDILADSGDYRDGCVFAEATDLQPGLYTIIPSLYETGKTGQYSLRIDSTKDVNLKLLPRDGAGLFSFRTAKACFGPMARKRAAPFHPNRLAQYTIICRFVQATTSQPLGIHDTSARTRSPLRLSLECGRGPDRQFVATSEGGEYSDSAIVRTDSFHMEPAVAARGDLWLVIDRLSGPVGPIEEWYEVEILTDVPQAFHLGVWREWDD